MASPAAKARTSKPIYLIVATSIAPPLGIGLRNSLPWGSVRSDMAFFRKVTTESRSLSPLGNGSQTMNAVIMGRKTWDSIPPRFRPLAGRLNVVVTRADVKSLASRILDELNSMNGSGVNWESHSIANDAPNSPNGTVITSRPSTSLPLVLITSSITDAVSLLDTPRPSLFPVPELEIGNIFGIGGAEIYRVILQDPDLRDHVRILQTQIRKLDGTAFECDTFFPESLTEWKQVSREAVQQWTGQDVPQGDQEWKRDEKAGVEIRVVGWEKWPAAT